MGLCCKAISVRSLGGLATPVQSPTDDLRALEKHDKITANSDALRRHAMYWPRFRTEFDLLMKNVRIYIVESCGISCKVDVPEKNQNIKTMRDCR